MKKRFNRTIATVPHPACQPEAARSLHCPAAEPDALNLAGDAKVNCHFTIGFTHSNSRMI
jgi:hypothetical protein